PGGPSRKRQLDLASGVGRLRRENDRLRMGRDIKSRAYVRARVLARDELLEKGLVGGKVSEIARATQLECFPQANLQMAVRRLHRTVLVTHAGIVAARLHVVMAAKLSIARRLVVLGRKVAVSGREPISAVLARYPTQLPERFLETLGQRGKALAAADRLDVLPAAVAEPEMIKQMCE